MTREGWLKLLRFLAFAIGMGILITSIYFSSMFFGVKNEKLVWIGVLVGIAITMLELVWRKPGMRGNFTVNVLAVLAYGYGIVTNTLGIMLSWGYNLDKASNMYILSDPVQLVLGLFPGIILEVLAEPLISWGLTGDAMADLLGNGLDMINSKGDTSNHRDPFSDMQSARENHRVPNEEPEFISEPPQHKPMGRVARQSQSRQPYPVPELNDDDEPEEPMSSGYRPLNGSKTPPRNN